MNGIGKAYWDVRVKTGKPLPFDGVLTGSSAILIDNQSAGVAYFDEEDDCWITKDGARITREVGVWTP